MCVSADICMHDPSGISDARKRGRGKCHHVLSKGYSLSERRAKWIRIQLLSYSKSMVELSAVGICF